MIKKQKGAILTKILNWILGRKMLVIRSPLLAPASPYVAKVSLCDVRLKRRLPPSQRRRQLKTNEITDQNS
ncbi:MAG: hypothetical protein UU23_C0001G0021 [Candidatus Curtissbacteria bacterium GW2011_GWA1_40_9]|uniref:Uncharacterized protein n=1 Tax=Candidatus Curtissbacteria bacterium GW2011_GWA1_40_9 TaxID=1618408 RepID=A0A0G0WS91_9BACT|nr:MAG: hypothetical protein UU23_C0001G0021 [Candidatus Curtissbacteria bacterium GW2011_GWA1_40_9]